MRGSVVLVALFLLAVLAGAPMSHGARFDARPASTALAANATYAPEGGQWNCGQGTETIGFFGKALGGSPPYTFRWSFGDATPNSTTQDPVHTYASAGPFRANLTVTDANGTVASASVAVTWVIPFDCRDNAPPSNAWMGLLVYVGLVGVVAVGLYGAVRWRRR